VAAVPLAALGFLSPVIAAAAMTLSSVLVVASSLRLRRFRPFDAPSMTLRPSRASRGLGPRPGAGVACPGDRPRRFPARL
jgi:Cu+-exporting ATPase